MIKDAVTSIFDCNDQKFYTNGFFRGRYLSLIDAGYEL